MSSNEEFAVTPYIEPVICTKDEGNFEIILTSFQSTSSCNIMHVNAICENKNFIQARSRGRKSSKRLYAIEMNMSRQLYLHSYSRIDSIDSLLNSTNINYVTWKYWHAPVTHAKKLAIATAYDIYLEIAEGIGIPECKVTNPVDYFTFRDTLSKQMTSYHPKRQMYKGDEVMRSVSQMNKEERRKEKKGSILHSCIMMRMMMMILTTLVTSPTNNF